jgi:competence protein ComEC
MVLVVLSSFLFAMSRQLPGIDPFECDDSVVRGRITEMPAETDFGYMQKMKVSGINNCGTVISGMEIMSFSKEAMMAGSDIIILADVKGRYRYRNPNSLINDIAITASVKDIHHLESNRNLTWFIQSERARVVSFLEDTFSKNSAAFLSAIVAGNKRDLSDEVRKGFASTGLSHLLAISGAHFGVFSFLIFSCFRSLIKRLPYKVLSRVTLYVTPSELSALFTLPFMVFYLFLSGAGIPAFRSFIMINIFLFGLLLGRKGTWKNAVAFAAFILLLISPDAIFDLSFILSFSAVVFIGFALQWKRENDDGILIPGLKESMSERLKRWVEVTFIISIAAYIGTLPFVLYFFHMISLVSPLTNMVIAPFVCFLIIPLAVLGSLSYLVTGFFPLANILHLLSENVLWLIGSMSDLRFIRMTLPAFPLICVVIFYFGFSLLMMLRRKVYGIGLSLLCVILMIAFPYLKKENGLEVTFLDVGQAESSVIVLPDGKIMVIDTGKNGKQTVGYLDYLGIDEIDVLVLSHAGRDHAGGFGYIRKMKEVNMLLDNGRIIYPPHLLSGIEHRPLQRGDVLEGKDYHIETLHPYDGFYSLYSSSASEDNNDSLVLRIDVEGRRFLFTGDIEREAEDNIVEVGGYLKSEVIKVAHHGSRTSSSREFIALTDPSIAVISAGMFNPYGHPHQEVMANLEDISAFSTSREGAIKISLKDSDKRKGKNVEVKTFEGFRLKRPESLIDEVENMKKLFTTW